MKNNKRIVIKVGTKVIAAKDRALDLERVRHIASQVSAIRDNGTEVILVTSGAIGAGMWLLGMKKRPSALADLQSAAAIGQNYLMDIYGENFKKKGYLTGQILLTQEDFNDRERYLNIKHTINSLLGHKAIPVINENDTVATDEIKCGDNDRLSSLVADLCQADKLIMLTDVDGLLDENGKVVSLVCGITSDILKLGGRSHCDLGTGGMETKIEAARTVTEAGIECVIANGREDNVLIRILEKGESLGTTFKCGKTKLIAKKRWIAFSSRPKGVIKVDEGAKDAINKRDKSLLASGVVDVSGDFLLGDVISVSDAAGREFARGLANYSSSELFKIKGLKSSGFKAVLGYKGRDEVIHKDNLVVL